MVVQQTARCMKNQFLIDQLVKGEENLETYQENLFGQYRKEIRKMIQIRAISDRDFDKAFVEGLTRLIQQIRDKTYGNVRAFCLQLLEETLRFIPDKYLIRLYQKPRHPLRDKSGSILIEKYEPYMRRVIAKNLPDHRRDWEEIYSHSVVAVLENLTQHKFNEKSSFKTYYSRIVSNKTIDQIKSYQKTRARFSDVEVHELEVAEIGRDEFEELIKDTQQVLGYMNQLRPNCLQILIKRQELNWRETAAALNITEAAAKLQWTRCRQNLAKLIDESDPGFLKKLTRNRIKRGRK